MVMALRQEGTVTDYRERFEELTAPLQHVPDDVLKGVFINGLKAELRLMWVGSLNGHAIP